ncbi:MAG: phytanoyl-CoA dioxygenase family protein [Rhodothermales bacterium]|nr:phytanoyl-CoA dioxygenase family protein [Rhodothermales bacterium]
MRQQATDVLKEQFDREGYAVAKALFSSSEAEYYRDHYTELRGRGAFPGDMAGFDTSADDPLLQYPRMIHMHRWDLISMDWLLSNRLGNVLRSLFDTDPLAVQSMLYFKPAGARGQALHQDNHFIRVQPGTCVAAWMALDECDETNGCLQVVPGSHKLPLLCQEPADTSKSFTDQGLSLPDGMNTKPVRMSPGDVLFFHGMIIHGSFPNVSHDRFRRSLIGHYVSSDAVKCADFYSPVLNMAGKEVLLADSPEGGPCGTWVEVDGSPRVEVVPG